jgi:5-methylcytosine-specific restriction enzyme subunit McrC
MLSRWRLQDAAARETRPSTSGPTRAAGFQPAQKTCRLETGTTGYNHQMNTLILTERQTDECRLDDKDLEFLLTAHGSHLRIVPTRRRDIYRVTPTRLIGTIGAPATRLVIRPKLPLRSLFHLLDPETEVSLSEATANLTEGTEALDFLAWRLARLLGERLASGLHRGYAERSTQGPFLLGRLDLAAQMRDSPVRDRLHCLRDELTPDILCNQLPRATLECVLRCSLLPDRTVRELERVLPGLQGISPVELSPVGFLAAAGQAPAAYRSLLGLCRLLAEGLLSEGAGATVAGPTFLLDLGKVFESYVQRGVREAFAGNKVTVVEQGWSTANEPVPGQPDLLFCPDVTLWAGDEPWAVVDAKWKRLPPQGNITADVYQVLAYCAALGAGRAVLVYPARRDSSRTYRLSRTGLRLEEHSLRVTANPDGCRRSLRRLGRTLRRQESPP